ncbi:TlpA family protein disulfide reductase [Streptomyces radicis]|uniref:TlpA family protein disulfide reductase n=1 Tax=Streptomyces radicis TaxID=1750517 RepID=A0A3A9WAP3_9ACTN|nr:TlpA disulfide reductase family protein [Streptomyces radicis]RKN09789.1 TlpA family protein disulfide reductase [Streptomyces radicis]RKN23426.1 TlpA family protein disulfide reductase [Streptomyces radicis]
MIQLRSVRAALAGVFAGGLLLTGCGADQAGPSGGDSNYVQGTGEITTVPVADRQEAPDLAGDTVDGDQLALSDYRGQVVVLNIWGSWCPPCIAEADNFVRVAEDTADDGVQFIGINTRDRTRENAQAFEREHGVPYPSLYDPDGRLLLEFPRGSLNPQAIPSTLVIDREGRIAARALKALTEEELRAALDPVMAEEG